MASETPSQGELQLERPSDDSMSCYLLDIAPELRNRIYEYVLVESDVNDEDAEPIFVDQNTKQPALTRTCRQIRNETLEMWYLNNNFEITVISCDAKLGMAFRAHVDGFHFSKHCRTFWSLAGGCNWEALVRWCCAIFHSYRKCPTVPEDGDEYENVIYTAHAITQASMCSSWDCCKNALDVYRRVAGAVDRGWLID